MLTISDLHEGNDYQFRVSAENAAGVGQPGPPSDTVKAKLPFGKSKQNLEPYVMI